jgi:hypothetical protein
MEQDYFESQWQETAKLVELDLLFDKEMENVVKECFGEDIIEQDKECFCTYSHIEDENYRCDDEDLPV